MSGQEKRFGWEVRSPFEQLKRGETALEPYFLLWTGHQKTHNNRWVGVGVGGWGCSEVGRWYCLRVAFVGQRPASALINKHDVVEQEVEGAVKEDCPLVASFGDMEAKLRGGQSHQAMLRFRLNDGTESILSVGGKCWGRYLLPTVIHMLEVLLSHVGPYLRRKKKKSSPSSLGSPNHGRGGVLWPGWWFGLMV